MKIIRNFFLLTVLIVGIVACSEEDEPQVQTYTIKVTNITAEAVDVFLSADGGSFRSRGTIPSGEFREYSDLELDVNYTLRASWEGNNADEYFSEQNISNSNPDIISLNYDIFE
jgi:hypothetical protein